MSYHSKLNNHNPPYPYDRMLCSLIHTEAHSVEDAETHLRHSWWPKGEEMGTHYWVDSNELTWKDDVEVPCAEIIQLDYSLYHLLRGKDRLERKLANTRSTLADGEGRLLSEQSWLKRTMTQFFGRKVEDEQGELDHLKEKADSLEHELEEIDQQIKNHSD